MATAIVREVVGGFFSAIGLGPVISGLFLSLIAAWQAWVEGKTPLDVSMYALAAFALAVFIVWVFVQVMAAFRGRPMTLAIRDRLTFGEIATRWANETIDEPGALSRDEILAELLAGVWKGHYENGLGESKLILMAAPVAHLREDDYGEWNRVMLLAATASRIRHALPKALIPKPMELTIEPANDPKAWKALVKAIPWDELCKMKISEYDQTDRAAYIEALSVSKPDFQRWARNTKRQLPRFWFG